MYEETKDIIRSLLLERYNLKWENTYLFWVENYSNSSINSMIWYGYEVQLGKELPHIN